MISHLCRITKYDRFDTPVARYAQGNRKETPMKLLDHKAALPALCVVLFGLLIYTAVAL